MFYKGVDPFINVSVNYSLVISNM